MEWDGKIYKSIGYTIQASDTDEIVEEAFEYIAKESFYFVINVYSVYFTLPSLFGLHRQCQDVPNITVAYFLSILKTSKVER